VCCTQSSDALAAVRQEARAEANRLTSLAGAPERARRQADMAVAELAGVRQLLEAADGRLGEADVALRGAQERAEQRQVRWPLRLLLAAACPALLLEI
jgi:hypothetical protein